MAFLQPGLRGGKVLINNGYRYQKNRVRRDKIYWRCWRMTCRVTLQTTLFDLEEHDPQIEVLHEPDHNHDDEVELVAERGVVNRMMEAIDNDPSVPTRRVYNAIVQDEEPEDIPAYNTVRSQLERHRASYTPPIPHAVEDVAIPNEWRQTWDGHRFLSYQDNDWGFLVYATNSNFTVLQRCDVLYMDGTFRSCPEPYAQFFTIHGKYHGRVLPLVMALMTQRTIGAYRQILHHVKVKVRETSGHRLRPERIVMDFEMALITASETEFPRATISGCYFHFCQSLWRKVQQLGLAGRYRQRRHLRRRIRQLMAIGYLPAPLVGLNFRNIIARASTQRLIVRHPELQEFIQYLHENYIIREATFPVPMWNVFRRDNDTRTNNHVEGFHQRWNNVIGRAHPSIWYFLRKMKDEQRVVEHSVAAARRGELPPPRRRKWRVLQRRIDRLIQEYSDGDRTIREYWNAVVHLIKAYA